MGTINSLLIAAVLLFATVMVWTYAAVSGNNTTFRQSAGIGGGPDVNTSTNKPNYRTEFGTLIPEHGNTAIMHLTMLYDGKDTTETSRILEDNTERLSNVIKSLGTSTDRELFYRTFRGHIVDYENYTKAKKEKNQIEVNRAKENLQMHAMDFGKLTHKLMPSVSEEQATKLMYSHALLTISIIDAHAEGDAARKLSEMNNANAQAGEFAEVLTKGAEEAAK